MNRQQILEGATTPLGWKHGWSTHPTSLMPPSNQPVPVEPPTVKALTRASFIRARPTMTERAIWEAGDAVGPDGTTYRPSGRHWPPEPRSETDDSGVTTYRPTRVGLGPRSPARGLSAAAKGEGGIIKSPGHGLQCSASLPQKQLRFSDPISMSPKSPAHDSKEARSRQAPKEQAPGDELAQQRPAGCRAQHPATPHKLTDTARAPLQFGPSAPAAGAKIRMVQWSPAMSMHHEDRALSLPAQVPRLGGGGGAPLDRAAVNQGGSALPLHVVAAERGRWGRGDDEHKGGARSRRDGDEGGHAGGAAGEESAAAGQGRSPASGGAEVSQWRALLHGAAEGAAGMDGEEEWEVGVVLRRTRDGKVRVAGVRPLPPSPSPSLPPSSSPAPPSTSLKPPEPPASEPDECAAIDIGAEAAAEARASVTLAWLHSPELQQRAEKGLAARLTEIAEPVVEAAWVVSPPLNPARDSLLAPREAAAPAIGGAAFPRSPVDQRPVWQLRWNDCNPASPPRRAAAPPPDQPREWASRAASHIAAAQRRAKDALGEAAEVRTPAEEEEEEEEADYEPPATASILDTISRILEGAPALRGTPEAEAARSARVHASPAAVLAPCAYSSPPSAREGWAASPSMASPSGPFGLEEEEEEEEEEEGEGGGEGPVVGRGLVPWRDFGERRGEAARADAEKEFSPGALRFQEGGWRVSSGARGGAGRAGAGRAVELGDLYSLRLEGSSSRPGGQAGGQAAPVVLNLLAAGLSNEEVLAHPRLARVAPRGVLSGALLELARCVFHMHFVPRAPAGAPLLGLLSPPPPPPPDESGAREWRAQKVAWGCQWEGAAAETKECLTDCETTRVDGGARAAAEAGGGGTGRARAEEERPCGGAEGAAEPETQAALVRALLARVQALESGRPGPGEAAEAAAPGGSLRRTPVSGQGAKVPRVMAGAGADAAARTGASGRWAVALQRRPLAGEAAPVGGFEKARASGGWQGAVHQQVMRPCRGGWLAEAPGEEEAAALRDLTALHLAAANRAGGAEGRSAPPSPDTSVSPNGSKASAASTVCSPLAEATAARPGGHAPQEKAAVGARRGKSPPWDAHRSGYLAWQPAARAPAPAGS